MSTNNDLICGMTKDRHDALQWGDATQLTQEEMAQGWHWCLEWDDMLIHPDMPEYGCCGCSGYPEPFAKVASQREKERYESGEVDLTGDFLGLFDEANANNEEFRKNPNGEY